MPFLVGSRPGASDLGVGHVGQGFDRDRSFYPTVTIVIASYYALFAVMAGSTNALAVESVAMMVFLTAAIVGFKGRTCE